MNDIQNEWKKMKKTKISIAKKREIIDEKLRKKWE